MAEQLQQIAQQLVAHLSEVLATTSGQVVRPLPAVGSGGVDWQVPITVGGDLDARITLAMSSAAARRITAVVLMSEAEPSDDEVADTLKEIVGQAAAACVPRDAGEVSLAVGLPVQEPTTPPSTAWQHDLVMDGDEPPRIALWSTGRDGSPSSPDTNRSPSRPHTDDSSSRSLADGAPGRPYTDADASIAASSGRQGPRNLDVVLDLELPITVRFGATRLTLDALSRLGPGSLIDLERSPDDPVDLLVNGRLVARGEVVVVSGCYGVRVRDVVSAADRLRSLEG